MSARTIETAGPMRHESTRNDRQKMQAGRIDRRVTERSERQRATAATAVSLWDSSPVPGAHPWLAAQGIAAHGLRQRGGRLLVPMRDAAGELWNLQFIGAGGGVKLLHGGRLFGLFHLIDGHDSGKTYDTSTLPELSAIWQPPEAIHITEDYTSAARIHADTGQPVAVAFALRNLRPAALELRACYPGARFVVWLPESPQNARGGSGIHWGIQSAAEAAALAVGGSVATLWGRS
jgi:putative DNA primase/helicase